MRKATLIALAALALALAFPVTVTQAEPERDGVVIDVAIGLSFNGGNEIRRCTALVASVNGGNTYQVTQYEDMDGSHSLTDGDRIILVWFEKRLAS